MERSSGLATILKETLLIVFTVNHRVAASLADNGLTNDNDNGLAKAEVANNGVNSACMYTRVSLDCDICHSLLYLSFTFVMKDCI